MRKRLKVILRPIIFTLLTVAIVATPVLAFAYSATYTITETGGTPYDMLGVLRDSPNTWLAGNNFMEADARDTRIETLSGLEKPHMMATDKILAATPVPAGSQTNLYFTTGNADASFDIITGRNGYITIPQVAALEPANDFEFEFSDVWVDTDAGTGKYLLSKPGAFEVYIDGATDITADILVPSYVSPTGFVDGAVAWSDEGKAYDDNLGTFAFTTASVNGTTWSDWLELTHAALDCSAVRFYLDNNTWFNPVEVDVFYDGGWNNVYDGAFANGVWIEASLGGTYSVTAMRLRAYNFTGGAVVWKFYEVDFIQSVVDATVTAVNVPTDEYSSIHVEADAVNFWISINGAVAGDWFDTVALAGATVPPNGSDWLLQYNYTTDFMPYMARYQHTVGVNLIVDYAPEAIVLNTWLDGDEDNGGSATVITDASITQAINYWVGALVTLTLSTAPPPATGETSICTSSTVGTITVSPAFSAALAIGDTFTAEFGTLADLEAPAQDARITWGVNPTGVAVALGGMVSSTQPSPGAGIETPTVDYFPDVEVSDWFEEPDVGVGGSLLTNPLRPFVTMMSDTTNMTELQAWRFLGLAMVLLVTVATAAAVKSHQMITGIACSASIGLLVAFSIWPLWALVFIIGGVIGGVIAERSPSL